MARTAYAVQPAALSGAQLNWTAPTTNLDSVVPNAGRVLLVNNASAGSITVTIHSNFQVHALVVPDRTVTIAAGKIEAISCHPSATEHLQADGTFWVDYSAVATVTVAYVAVP